MHPLNKHPLYTGIMLGGGGESDDPPGRIPQVYIDVAKLITDALCYRYLAKAEAEQLFDVIVCGLEACDVSVFDAQVMRAQLRETVGRDT